MAQPKENYSRLYKGAIETELRVKNTQITPMNAYRISTYIYSDGQTRSLRGVDETLIFVTGVYKKVVYGLKLSKIKPQFFFEWAKGISSEMSVLNEETGLLKFSELAPSYDDAGNIFYKQRIRDSTVLAKPKAPYRSYKMSSIRSVSEIYFKKEVVKRYYA